MWAAFSCCICFVLSLACSDKPQVTYNISEQRNTQLAVPYGSGAVSWTQMMSNKGIKREKSYIHIFKLQTELNVHKVVNFFVLRDNQFTSVGLQSTIVLYTQEHSNTPCWGIKNLKKKTEKNTRENYPSAEIKAQSRSSPVLSSTLKKKTWIFLRADPILNGHLRCGKLGQRSDMFSLFQNIPVFGEHLYYAEVITAIASFSDLKFLFQQKLCEV